MTTIKRIFKQGWKSWNRNKTVSASSIFILTITLIIFSSLFLWQAVFNNTIEKLKNKADIAIYFDTKLDQNNDNIKGFVKRISSNTLVANTEYIDKITAYNKYKEENANNSAISKGLEFIGNNPFGDRLIIKTKNIEDYQSVYEFIKKDLETNNIDNIIYKINYVDIKSNIDNINAITVWFANAGVIILGLFIIMSSLIIYNTTRISIFVFRNEISVMKLVGASNWFIRGPFIVESAISGLVASIISVASLYPISYYLHAKSSIILGGFDIFKYYENNIILLFLILFGFAILVSIISAFFATRKYLLR